MLIRIFSLLFIIVFSCTFLFADQDPADTDLFTEFQEISVSPTKSVVSDPLGGYNRFMTGVNDVVYSYALIPVAKGFGYVVPKPVRRGISNVFTNAFFPIRFANSILQLKVKKAGVEAARFAVNSTIGVAGIFDPASSWLHLEAAPPEDFGQTLGKLGIGAGPYFVWPILGPSNIRDSVGRIVDSFFNPTQLFEGGTDIATLRLMQVSNEISLNPDQYDTLKGASLDFYSFMRDGYSRQREKQILE
jgi:phospholipid-binding lipoprotein MlaA